MTGQSSSQAASSFQWWKPALFFLVVIVGLWFVKWQPYYGKAFTAAETHSIGKSILAQADSNPLKAAWDYALVYFLAVWKAAVLGVLLGSLIQVLIPRNWLLRTLGQSRFRGTLLGAIFALPGMMCTCCAAPVAAGMRKQQVSMGGALAFWLGNPLLNPATLVFMGFVLGWQFALIRLVAGLATVLVVATLVQKWVKEAATQPAAVPDVSPQIAEGGFFSRWLRALWTLFWNTIPVYILAVLALGAARLLAGWRYCDDFPGDSAEGLSPEMRCLLEVGKRGCDARNAADPAGDIRRRATFAVGNQPHQEHFPVFGRHLHVR